MKLAIQTALTSDRNLVLDRARAAGLNVTQVSLVNGRENRIAVEYDEQSEKRVSRAKLAEIAAAQGLQVDVNNIDVTPSWAPRLRASINDPKSTAGYAPGIGRF